MALGEQIDVLLANVPYVPTQDIGQLPREARLHEPQATLDGGADGLGLSAWAASCDEADATVIIGRHSAAACGRMRV